MDGQKPHSGGNGSGAGGGNVTGTGGGRAPKFTEGMLDTALLLEALEIRPGQTVVDAGCGTGYMARLFSAAVGNEGKVYALDPDPHFIGPLKEETRGSNIEAVLADITGPTPIPGASVDILYMSMVLHQFRAEKIEGFIAEVDRLIKKGGILAVVELEKKETPFGPPLWQRHSPEELARLIPFSPVKTIRAGEHFYMQVFEKT